MSDQISNLLDNYDSVSVNEVERILEFAREAWLHGFPIVRKETGRSKQELLAHACLLLLVVTGCLTKDRRNDEAAVMAKIKKAIDEEHRLVMDARDFLEQVRSPERYTREAIAQRRQAASSGT